VSETNLVSLEKIKKGLPLLTVVTLLWMILYFTMQRTIRSYANRPQNQISADLARGLELGKPLEGLVPPGKVDLLKSEAVYVIIYDNEMKPLASNADLEGRIPIPPAGVFSYAREHHKNTLTWQPRRGVREAIVLNFYGGEHPGFVLVGRSLREAENLISYIGNIILKGWIVSIVLTFLVCLML